MMPFQTTVKALLKPTNLSESKKKNPQGTSPLLKSLPSIKCFCSFTLCSWVAVEATSLKKQTLHYNENGKRLKTSQVLITRQCSENPLGKTLN